MISSEFVCRVQFSQEEQCRCTDTIFNHFYISNKTRYSDVRIVCGVTYANELRFVH